MPCKKFISIRFKPGDPTRVYIDDMTNARRSFPNLKTFRLESPIVDQKAAGTSVKVDALRWPPGEVYGAPISMALAAQWPFGTKLYETNDVAGHTTGRSLSGVEFTYDEAAATLSWNQDYKGTGAKVSGSVGFNATTRIWYVTLEIDPAAPNTKGMMLVDGEDIAP